MLTYPIYHYHHFLEVMEIVDSRAAEVARNAQIELILDEYDDENSLLDMSDLSSKHKIPTTTLHR